jgi:Sulfate permease family
MAELASQPDVRPHGWHAYLPGLTVITSYQRKWLPRDIVAGLVLSALLVPQGMAYAELAGLPPVTGLYTSILCLLGYAVFGPSRILVLGPDSALGPLSTSCTGDPQPCGRPPSRRRRAAGAPCARCSHPLENETRKIALSHPPARQTSPVSPRPSQRRHEPRPRAASRSRQMGYAS